MKYLGLFFIFFGVMGGNSLVAKVERAVSVELIEERINGRLFSYRLEVVQGNKVQNTRKEQWVVDSQVLSQEEYEATIDKERLEELREKRQKERQSRLEKYEFNQAQRVALTKKIVRQLVEKIEDDCKKFNNYNLDHYMAYTDTTIASEIDFLNIPTHYLEPARQLLLASDDSFSFEKAQEIIDVLERYPIKLQGLFEDTVKNAIAYCDDTQRLKKLLEVIS